MQGGVGAVVRPCRDGRTGDDDCEGGIAVSKKKPASPPARFAVGSLVRVKPGTTVPDFEDLPLGGWAGTVIEVDRRAPTTYLIEWNRHTLRHMHR
jgi:hypothetical protein